MRAAWMVVALLACTRHNAAKCLDGVCTDPALSYCDTNGVIDGEPSSCIAVSCTPGEFAVCDGDTALSCNSGGDGYDGSACEHGCRATVGCVTCAPGASSCVDGTLQTCDADGNVASSEECSLGCGAGSTPRCATIEPRYLPEVCSTPALNDVDIASSGTFDTDLDSICTGGIVKQTGGPDVCIVRGRAITIEASVTLRVIASSEATAEPHGRVLALVADRELLVAGVIDVSANGVTGGPGSSHVKSGGAVAKNTGGGGAGFRTAGGNGGNASTNGGASNGGNAMQEPSALSVIEGGPGSQAAGGGGALLLISCMGTVRGTGTIIAAGGGGPGGMEILGGGLPGQGGGAGGYVVLQGADVMVSGSVFAKGGGGGAGGLGNTSMPASDDPDGHDGGSVPSPSAGGLPLAGCGAGGLGGASDAPTPGGAATSSNGTPGGGGGSVGFLQTYTPTGVLPKLSPAQAVPSFQPNANVPTR